MIIDKQSNIKSQWQIGILVVTITICEIFLNDLNISNITNQIFKFLILLISVSVIGIGNCVKFKNGKFIAGKCLGILYLYKIEKEVFMRDIIETSIIQNKEYYFEVQAVTKNGILTLAKIPNRINAEKKLNEINSMIKNIR